MAARLAARSVAAFHGGGSPRRAARAVAPAFCRIVRAPVAIIRGEWDSMCTDADAAWLFGAFTSSPIRRDVKISRGTHLMHLETSRCALYRETQNFLAGGDAPPT